MVSFSVMQSSNSNARKVVTTMGGALWSEKFPPKIMSQCKELETSLTHILKDHKIALKYCDNW